MSSNMERSRSEESLDSTGKQKSFQRLCVRFAEKTSMQGVPYINSAKFVYSKILWTILLLAAIGTMTFHLYYLCNQFFAWPKISKLTLNFSSLELPEVTLCNNNVIRKSKLHLASKELRDFIRTMDPGNLIKDQIQSTVPGTAPVGKRKKRFVSELRGVNFSGYNDYDYEDLYDDNEGLGPETELNQIEETFETLFMEHSRDVRVAMGHNISDMLLDCSFNGRQCYAENFTLFTTAEYGNCYTLRAKNYLTSQSGPSKGLQLILYMENEDYLDGITQGYGARLSLRDKGQIPFPADDGFFVNAYSENDIGLKLTRVEREGEPYGTCDSGAWFETDFKRTYSRQACQRLWEQSYILEKCGCFNEEYAEIYRGANKSGIHPCRNKETKCMAKHTAELAKRALIPTCNSPCDENLYTRQLSSRQWPTEAYSNFLLQGVCEKQPGKCANMRTYDKRQLSLNFVKILLYYEDLNYELIVEEPEIENAQFASDVGGAVGLWIGLSMLSIFEVVQLLMELCAFAHHKCKKSGEKKQKENERKKKEMKKKNYEINQIEFGNRDQNYGYQSDNYDHLKRSNGYPRDMYNPAIRAQTQRSHEYQSVDDYYIYKGSRKFDRI